MTNSLATRYANFVNRTVRDREQVMVELVASANAAFRGEIIANVSGIVNGRNLVYFIDDSVAEIVRNGVNVVR